MRKASLFTTSVIAMMVAMPALAADCNEELQALNQKISKNESNYRIVAGTGMGSDIRKLRDAARIFARNGKDDACENVVEAIEDMLESRRSEMQKDAKSENWRDEWFKSETARIKTAMPVDKFSSPLRASAVIGADVRNMNNEDLGEIEDVVLTTEGQKGDIKYALVARGGFLGLGEKLVAVPWNRFRLASDNDDDEHIFVLNVSEEELEKAPSFDRKKWRPGQSDAWQRDVDAYYKQRPQQ